MNDLNTSGLYECKLTRILINIKVIDVNILYAETNLIDY